MKLVFYSGEAPDLGTYNVDLGETGDFSTDARPIESQHPRISRQVARMRVARARQEAQVGSITDIDGAPFISMSAQDNHPGYWKTLRRVVRRARSEGYASESVEGTFLYMAFYDEGGVGEDLIKNPLVTADLQMSGILPTELRSRDSILVCGIPSQEARSARLFLPYFLYSLTAEGGLRTPPR